MDVERSPHLMRLSIVIPAHNEEQRIGRTLDAYLPYFAARHGADMEFIIVVNGSTDRTADIVRDYAARYPALRSLVEPARIGKGGALMRGFAAACGELIGFVDADGATPPEAFQDLVDNLGDSDAIIASRWRRGSKVSPRQPLVRLVTSRVFNLFTRLLFGLRLTDTQCGAKLMRGTALRKVLPSLGVTQWAFDVDLLLHLKRIGCRIREIPTVWQDVEGSKVEVARTSAEMLAALIRLRLIYSPLHGFVPLYDSYIQPFAHLPGMDDPNRVFRHSLLHWAGTQASAACAILFQLAMVRMLSLDDYGALAAMLGILMVLSGPIVAMRQTMAHFTAILLKRGEAGRVNGMLLRSARHIALVAILVVTAAVFHRHALATFYRMESATPLIAVGMAGLVSMYGALAGGTLAGAQEFIWATGAGIASSFALPILAMGLVAAGWSVAGALWGSAIGAFLNLAIAMVGVRQVVRRAVSTEGSLEGVYPYMAKHAATLGGLAILISADTVLVRHYFTSGEAGVFATAAMAARMVIFLPGMLAGMLLPRVASLEEASVRHGRTLFRALVLRGAMAISVAVVCSLFPGPILWLLTGHAEAQQLAVLRGMAWAFVPATLVVTLTNFELAQRRFRVAVPLAFCAAVYAIGAAVWHGSFNQVVTALFVANTLALILTAACLPWRALSGKPVDGAVRVGNLSA